MEMITLALGALAANCYILPCGDGGAVLIDIGEGAGRVKHTLGELSLTPRAILLTHGHYDHVAGVEAIRSAYECPVYIHEADAVMLTSSIANRAAEISDNVFQPVKSYKTVKDGDVLHIGTLDIEVIHTPGHTPGGVCYRIGDSLFTGDTLFRMSMGRTDLGGNVQEMRETLRMLAHFEDDCKVYPGHFGSSTIRFEQAHNPCLRGL